MSYCKSFIKKHNGWMYAVSRILFGGMFFIHGAQKLFGWFGGTATGFTGLMGAAGVIEFVVGLTLLLGLFTRLSATLGALQMLGAYFMAHFSISWNPLLNGGEVALLYFEGFLILCIPGNGKFSL